MSNYFEQKISIDPILPGLILPDSQGQIFKINLASKGWANKGQ